jgi:hypothetical protein
MYNFKVVMSKQSINDLFDPSKLCEASLRKYQVYLSEDRATSSWTARRKTSRAG